MEVFWLIGRSSAIVTLDITVGSSGSFTGYDSTVPFGSCTPTVFPVGGGTIVYLVHKSGGGPYVELRISPSLNSGWTNMLIGTTNFLRTAASYSAFTWNWASIASDPFSGVGTHTAVVFT